MPSHSLCRYARCVALALMAFACADADAGTCDRARDWAEGCSSDAGLVFSVERCVPGQIVLGVAVPGADPLGIDVGSPERISFRMVGDYGLAPVGEWPSWDAVAQPLQEAFEAAAACVARRAPPIPGWDSTASTSPPTAGVPWYVVIGLTLCLVAMVGTVTPRALVRTAWIGVGVVATFAARWLLLPVGFFHQNGQGPLWIRYALGEPSSYGPGQFEVFGLIASITATPDAAIMAGQAGLGALAAGAVWVLGRACGASPLTAAALAVAWSIQPITARLVQSESYFATSGSLLLIAAASLAASTRTSDRWQIAVGLAGAGLVTAAAMRVHPYSWPAAVLVPAVTLFPRAVFGRFAAIVVIFGAVLGLAAGGAVATVLSGELGDQYLPVLLSGPSLLCGIGLASAALLLGLAWRWIGGDAVAPVVVVGLTVTLALSFYITERLGLRVPWAYAALFASPMLAVATSIASRVERRWASCPATVIGLAAVAVAVATWPVAADDPTDALEQRAALEWRAQLPDDARVAYLHRHGGHVLYMPLYGSLSKTAGGKGIALVTLDVTLRADNGGPLYLYEPSLCALPGHRAACERFAARFELEPVWSSELPARPSNPSAPYAEDPVEVRLSRVRQGGAGR